VGGGDGNTKRPTRLRNAFECVVNGINVGLMQNESMLDNTFETTGIGVMVVMIFFRTLVFMHI
jgi:hypothetical protein